MAVCVLKPEKTLEPSDLIKFVGSRIAGYKKPRYVKFVKDFPILEDGSPDRKKIKELYGTNRSTRDEQLEQVF